MVVMLFDQEAQTLDVHSNETEVLVGGEMMKNKHGLGRDVNETVLCLFILSIG